MKYYHARDMILAMTAKFPGTSTVKLIHVDSDQEPATRWPMPDKSNLTMADSVIAKDIIEFPLERLARHARQGTLSTQYDVTAYNFLTIQA